MASPAAGIGTLATTAWTSGVVAATAPLLPPLSLAWLLAAEAGVAPSSVPPAGRSTTQALTTIARTAAATAVTSARRRRGRPGTGSGEPGGGPLAGAVDRSSRSPITRAGAAAAGTMVSGAAGAVVRGRPSAARAAEAKSTTVPYRSAGSLAMPRATTSSMAGGTPGTSRLGVGTSRLRWAYISEGRSSPGNGRTPVRHSCSRQVRE